MTPKRHLPHQTSAATIVRATSEPTAEMQSKSSQQHLQQHQQQQQQLEDDSRSRQSHHHHHHPLDALTHPATLFAKNSLIYPYLNSSLHTLMHEMLLTHTFERVVEASAKGGDEQDMHHTLQAAQNLSNEHSDLLKEMSMTCHKVLQRHLERNISSNCPVASLNAKIERYSCKGSNWEIWVNGQLSGRDAMKAMEGDVQVVQHKGGKRSSARVKKEEENDGDVVLTGEKRTRRRERPTEQIQLGENSVKICAREAPIAPTNKRKRS